MKNLVDRTIWDAKRPLKRAKNDLKILYVSPKICLGFPKNRTSARVLLINRTIHHTHGQQATEIVRFQRCIEIPHTTRFEIVTAALTLIRTFQAGII